MKFKDCSNHPTHVSCDVQQAFSGRDNQHHRVTHSGEGRRKARIGASLFGVLALFLASLGSQSLRAEQVSQATGFDRALAERLGADERGMRSFVLVILKSGPTRVPDGEQRKAMFAGHFANMERLSGEGKLALAGPFAADPDGWRGLFVLAVDDLDEARRLTETDPVIVNGEMVAEYHRWYGSAATMMIPEIHAKLTPPQP